MRLSTIPYALGAVAFCYLLVRLAGLQAKAAVFVTLLFGLSPLFLPVAVSYMTDAPGLFFYFASLYFLIRAADSSADGRGYGWLALGVVAGFLGGTGRQVVWFVPLVVLPYLALVRRQNVRFAAVTVGGWILTLGGMAAVMSWFKRDTLNWEGINGSAPLFSRIQSKMRVKPARKSVFGFQDSC